MENLKYTCPKCNNKKYKIAELRASGGRLSSIFDLETEKYTSITCERCTYTEFYKAKSSDLTNVFDFFVT